MAHLKVKVHTIEHSETYSEIYQHFNHICLDLLGKVVFEAVNQGHLNHPNILPITDLWFQFLHFKTIQFCIATPLCEQDLHAFMKSSNFDAAKAKERH